MKLSRFLQAKKLGKKPVLLLENGRCCLCFSGGLLFIFNNKFEWCDISEIQNLIQVTMNIALYVIKGMCVVKSLLLVLVNGKVALFISKCVYKLSDG